MITFVILLTFCFTAVFAERNTECWCKECDPNETIGALYNQTCYYIQLRLSNNASTENVYRVVNNIENDPILPTIAHEIRMQNLSITVAVCLNSSKEDCMCRSLDIGNLSILGKCDNDTNIRETRTFYVLETGEEKTEQRSTLTRYFYFLGAAITFLTIGMLIGMGFMSYFFRKSNASIPITNPHL